MPRKPKTLVLDSWAIMSYLQGEPSAEKVADIIADAHEDHVPLLMSVVNAGEFGTSLPAEPQKLMLTGACAS